MSLWTMLCKDTRGQSILQVTPLQLKEQSRAKNHALRDQNMPNYACKESILPLEGATSEGTNSIVG